MGVTIKNATEQEINILESMGINWFPESRESTDIFVAGNREYCDAAMQAIGRN